MKNFEITSFPSSARVQRLDNYGFIFFPARKSLWDPRFRNIEKNAILVVIAPAMHIGLFRVLKK
jgi:hypothetical protein